MRVKYLVVHHNGVAGRTIDDIRRTHKEKGWSDVGYHYVIHEDGSLHRGRAEGRQGAHARGLNSSAVGICVIGNGNVADFNAAQYATLRLLLRMLLEAYGLDSDRVVGHREVNAYVSQQYHTRKLCPGKLVDLDLLRRSLDVDELVA